MASLLFQSSSVNPQAVNYEETYLEFTEYGSRIQGEILIDFGTVAVFGEYIKCVYLSQFDIKTAERFIIRKTDTYQPLYPVFSFNKLDGYIKNGKDFTLKVLYAPLVPFRNNVENFEYVDNCGNIVRIIIRGEANGPKLVASVKHLEFYAKKCNKTKLKKTFEITNISDVPADFKFDLSETSSFFDVTPKAGKLSAGKHLFVKVTFKTAILGHFSKELVCLIWGQNPIAVQLFGISTNKDVNFDRIRLNLYPIPAEDRKGYPLFFRDSPVARKSTPVVSLSKKLIDFGRVLKFEKVKVRSGRTLTLTNHSNNDLNIQWFGQNTVFRINPSGATIEAQGIAIFQCSFVPTDDHSFYCETLSAQIYWKERSQDDGVVNVPFTTKIRVLGHSYAEGEIIIPNIQIETENIVFPPCLPGMIVYSNFKIINLSSLPVAFKLIPPRLTRITLKPMVGLIKDFEIIAVVLKTELTPHKIYREQWFIEFNLCETRKMPIYFVGVASIPNVLIDKNGVVKFDKKIQIGTTSIRRFPIKNISVHDLSFNLKLDYPEYVELNPSKGKLFSNEEVTIACAIKASEDAPNQVIVTCELQAVENSDTLIGTKYSHQFEIGAEFGYSELCLKEQKFLNDDIDLLKRVLSVAEILVYGYDVETKAQSSQWKLAILLNVFVDYNVVVLYEFLQKARTSFPRSHHFDIVTLKEVIATEFHLFNYGDTTVPFQLICMNGSDKKDRIKIEPTTGEVEPNEKVAIKVEITIASLGDNEIIFKYIDHSETPDVVQEGKEIFNLTFKCEMFTLMVEQIAQHNFGPLFGVHEIWDVLQIDRINEAWGKNQEKELIHIYLPEFVVGSRKRYAILCVRNISKFTSSISLKRKQLCHCQLKEIRASINLMNYKYDCSHRELVTMEISDTNFYVNSRQFLTINVNYNLPGSNEVAYVMTVEEKTIDLRFHLLAIPENVGKISYYARELCIEMSYLSQALHDGVVQMFWLYNNTGIATKYNIDMDEITHLCQIDGAKVLDILNPKGQLEPRQRLPIMVEFHPIETKLYTVNVPITLGNEHSKLHISGHGISSKKFLTVKHSFYGNEQNLKNYQIAVITPPNLNFNDIIDWSTSVQVICIRNITVNKILQYEWEDTKIKEIVDIRAFPKSGILGPKESQRVFIRVKSYNASFITEMLMNCSITDRTELYLYNRSIEMYAEAEKRLEGQFIMTETSTIIPQNKIVIRDKPVSRVLSLHIHLNGTNWRDAERSWDETKRFSIFPPDIMNINVIRILDRASMCYPSNNILLPEYQEELKFILEQLISDFVFSKGFRDILMCSKIQRPPYYDQFTVDDKAIRQTNQTNSLYSDVLQSVRRSEIEKFFSKPPPTVLASILTLLLFDSLHHQFKLGPAFPKDLTDAEIDAIIENAVKESKCCCEIKDTTV